MEANARLRQLGQLGRSLGNKTEFSRFSLFLIVNFNCVRMELTSCNKNFTLYGRASVLCSFFAVFKKEGTLCSASCHLLFHHVDLLRVSDRESTLDIKVQTTVRMVQNILPRPLPCFEPTIFNKKALFKLFHRFVVKLMSQRRISSSLFSARRVSDVTL